MKYLHRFIPLVARLVPGLILAASIAAPASAAPLPRANIVLPNTVAVDAQAGIATLPLHRGTAHGRTVWYIVTDSSDATDAKRRGAIFAPLLANVGDGCAACLRSATESRGAIAFPGAPDFSDKRVFRPGTTGFPPAAAAPGAHGDTDYTPFLRIGKAVVNAPIVATGDGPFDVRTHSNTQDRVIAIDSNAHTVTLALAKGFFDGKRVVYLSTEASDPGAATIERATFVPALKAKAGLVPIDVVANGTHQGLGFVALRGNLDADATARNAASLGSSMNVLSTFPVGATSAAYSPLWNVEVIAWKSSATAVQRGTVLKSLADVAGVATATSGPGGKPVGPVGFVVNCPVIAFVDGAP
jgi:hypothetical protein